MQSPSYDRNSNVLHLIEDAARAGGDLRSLIAALTGHIAALSDRVVTLETRLAAQEAKAPVTIDLDFGLTHDPGKVRLCGAVRTDPSPDSDPPIRSGNSSATFNGA